MVLYPPKILLIKKNMPAGKFFSFTAPDVLLQAFRINSLYYMKK